MQEPFQINTGPKASKSPGYRPDTPSRNNGAKQRQQQQMLLIFGCVGLGLIVLVGLLLVSTPQKKSRPGARRPASRPKAARQTRHIPRDWPDFPAVAGQEDDDGPVLGGANAHLSGSARPRGPETLADLMNQTDEPPVSTETVTGALAAARRAMAARDLPAAKKHLDAARRTAHTPSEQSEVQRVQKLLYGLEAFWKAVCEMFGNLRALEEMKIDDRVILVVQADKDQVIVRAAGRNYIYGMENLPGKLAVRLAERGLASSPVATQLCMGAFHAVDREGNRQAARQHFEQAGAEGKPLLAELEMAPPPKSSPPSP